MCLSAQESFRNSSMEKDARFLRDLILQKWDIPDLVVLEKSELSELLTFLLNLLSQFFD